MGSSDLPERIGPYRIEGILGRGGMGVVYRARHETRGDAVALKTVHGPDAGAVAGMRREIHALARLEHPGVVRVLDDGIEEGSPWYAMELIEGKSLRRWLAESWGGPADAASSSLHEETTALMAPPAIAALSGTPASLGDARAEPRELEAALDLAMLVAEALAYIHGEGVLHRDLKPENVLVLPGGSIVLVDFGISVLSGAGTGREVVGAPDSSGTLSYMSPEQSLGQLVDARTDLYAFGCILFELLTGTSHLGGGGAAEILGRLQDEAAPPPSSLVRGLPAALDPLVLALLEKDPARRLGYADVAARRLARIASAMRPSPAKATQAGEDKPGRPIRSPAPMARPYLYRPRLSGRARELELLRDAIRSARRGAGALLVLAGESGAGKTRLLLELASLASREGFTVDTGLCLPVMPPGESSASGGSPLGAIRGLLQGVVDRCRERGPAEEERLLGRSARLLAVFEPLVETLEVWRRGPEPIALPAEAARLRLYRHLRKLLRTLAAGRPRLLIVDDLQWADELTMGLLAHLVARGTERLLIVGACRTEESTPALDALLALDGVRRVEVGRLDPEGVRAIVRDMLAFDGVPDGFVEALRAHSEGNPLFVAEYLRLAGEEGILRRDDEGVWSLPVPDPRDAGRSLGLPGSLRDLLERRIAPVGGDDRALLDAAAVLGPEVETALLEGCLGEDFSPSRIAGALRRLELRQLLALVPSGARFTHDKLREIAYELMAPARRIELHDRAARELEAHPDDSRLADLGRHHERAGRPERAFPCYIAAASRAESRYAYDEAESVLRAALRVAPPRGGGAIDARLELARRRLRSDGMDEAQRLVDEALAMAREEGDELRAARALGQRGDVARRQGHLDAQLTLHQQSLEIYRALGAGDLEREAMLTVASALVSVGRMDEAQELLRETVRRAEAAGDAAAGAKSWLVLGTLLRKDGDVAGALRAYDLVAVLAAEAGEHRTRIAARLNRSIALCELGLIVEARDGLRDILEVVREAGDRVVEAGVLAALGNVVLELGEIEEARSLFGRTLRIHDESGYRLSAARVNLNLATAHVVAGDLDRARETARSALEVLRESGDVAYEAFALIPLWEAALIERDLAGVREIADRLRTIARELRDEHTTAWSLVVDASCERLAGNTDGCIAAATEAIERLESLGRPVDTGRALVVLGLARKDAGLDFAPQVAAVEAIVARLGLPPGSLLARDLAQLRGEPPARA